MMTEAVHEVYEFRVKIVKVEPEIVAEEDSSSSSTCATTDTNSQQEEEWRGTHDQQGHADEGVNWNHEMQLFIESEKLEEVEADNQAQQLDKVSKRLWKGAVFGSQWLLDMAQQKRTLLDRNNTVVVDLGAGVGFLSLICSMYAHKVICTDKSTDALEIARRNCQRNERIADYVSQAPIQFWQLDWEDNLQSDSLWRELTKERDIMFIARYEDCPVVSK